MRSTSCRGVGKKAVQVPVFPWCCTYTAVIPAGAAALLTAWAAAPENQPAYLATARPSMAREIKPRTPTAMPTVPPCDCEASLFAAFSDRMRDVPHVLVPVAEEELVEDDEDVEELVEDDVLVAEEVELDVDVEEAVLVELDVELDVDVCVDVEELVDVEDDVRDCVDVSDCVDVLEPVDVPLDVLVAVAVALGVLVLVPVLVPVAVELPVLVAVLELEPVAVELPVLVPVAVLEPVVVAVAEPVLVPDAEPVWVIVRVPVPEALLVDVPLEVPVSDALAVLVADDVPDPELVALPVLVDELVAVALLVALAVAVPEPVLDDVLDALEDEDAVPVAVTDAVLVGGGRRSADAMSTMKSAPCWLGAVRGAPIATHAAPVCASVCVALTDTAAPMVVTPLTGGRMISDDCAHALPVRIKMSAPPVVARKRAPTTTYDASGASATLEAKKSPAVPVESSSLVVCAHVPDARVKTYTAPRLAEAPTEPTAMYVPSELTLPDRPSMSCAAPSDAVRICA